MELLGSDWLRKMAEKSGTTPHAQLEGLIETLDDWLQAPGITDIVREQFSELDVSSLTIFQHLIVDIVSPLGLRNPQELADQLTFLLIGAMQQQLRAPESRALLHTKKAALLLLNAANNRKRYFTRMHLKPVALSLAAGLCLVVAAGLMAPWHTSQRITAAQATPTLKTSNISITSFNPDELVALHQRHDQFAKGDCLYPQALMLSPEQRGIYLDFVRNTQAIGIKTDRKSLETLRRTLNSIECFYPQTLMTS